MALSKEERAAKLTSLARTKRFRDSQALLTDAVYRRLSPGICINAGCAYAREVEPGERRGFCEHCKTETVQSCLVLAELIQ